MVTEGYPDSISRSDLTLARTGFRISLTIERVPFECLDPRMERLKGETGVSPVLSRNCDEGIPLSQVARSKVFTTLSLKGGGDFGLATAKQRFSPPWHRRREVLPSQTSLGDDRHFCLASIQSIFSLRGQF